MRILFLSAFMFLGCKYSDESINDLKVTTARLADENFQTFANHYAGIRSFENGGKDICIIVSDMKDTICRAGFVVLINIETNEIVQTRKTWLDDEICPIDTVLAKRMALRLSELQIAGLQVQEDSVVYVITKKSKHGLNLARFPKSYDIEKIRGNWKYINNGWYERKGK